VALAEVEHRLRAHPAIADAAVTVDDAGPGRVVLHAAVVLHRGARPAVAAAARGQDLAAFLRDWLPPVMVPRTVTPMDRIPRDAGGEPETAAIPRPPRADDGAAAGLSPDTLRAVTAIVAGAMGVSDAGPHTDLAGLGLTSLQAATIQARLTERFGAAPPRAQWPRAPSVAGLARQVSNAPDGPSAAVSVKPEGSAS
jgi:acyl carrier protein